METDKANKNTTNKFKTNLLEEDATISAFRRRNRILIFVLFFIFVLFTLVLAVLISYLFRNFLRRQPHVTDVNYAVKAYCQVSSDYFSCLRSFDGKFTPKSSVNPSQIYSNSLRIAAVKLEKFVSILPNLKDRDESAADFVDTCSNSSIEAMNQISNALARMRKHPFVEAQSDDQRSEIVKWMNNAAINLDSCLEKVDPAMATAVEEVKELVENGAYFVHSYVVVLKMIGDYEGVERYRGVHMETLLGISMVGLQLLYVFFMFCCLFRIRR
ncbi:uncharacterized protein LOC127246038 [Andrographis paniculata]|uniref:uncharacterized protein LOC127246038 n=1 Tax=Andrographis paniculata TaxID=175694 RepID=UPI0021E86DE4|nr:uncharacterized protein LOC127246038 [Andrographis paniculata]